VKRFRANFHSNAREFRAVIVTRCSIARALLQKLAQSKTAGLAPGGS
jgi:hypothetical protein